MAVMVVSILFVGCRQTNTVPTADSNSIIISLKTSNVLKTGKDTLSVRVTDGSGAPINNAKVEVRGDMNHAGMQPVFGEASTASDGLYEVPFEWSMGGDWVLEVTVTLADGTKSTDSFFVSVTS
jgi:YtkA-like